MAKSVIITLLILLLTAMPTHADMVGDIIEEINSARTDPARYAGYLKSWRSCYTEKGIMLSPSRYLWNREGVESVDEAIDFMENRCPMPPLVHSAGLDMSAREIVRLQGPTGQFGHILPDGLSPGKRARHYGRWGDVIGENIAYGLDDPRHIVMLWIIDDSVPQRSHRYNIFKSDYNVVGAAFGWHKKLGIFCVMDFAGGFEPN